MQSSLAGLRRLLEVDLVSCELDDFLGGLVLSRVVLSTKSVGENPLEEGRLMLLLLLSKGSEASEG